MAWCSAPHQNGHYERRVSELGGVRAVEQRLAAQLAGDAVGFTGRGRRGLVITRAEQVFGLVEQAVG